MAANMNIWRKLVKDEIDTLADESWQQDLWLDKLPGYVGSPGESIEGYFSGAAIEEFLERSDTGFSQEQLDSLRHVMDLMDNICRETNIGILPPTFIDDPRWQKVMAAAKEAKKLLDSNLV